VNGRINRPDCGFRGDRATRSDLIPPPIPI
jgi:hypothetical protein